MRITTMVILLSWIVGIPSAQAENETLSPTCEKAVMDLMKTMSTINMGPSEPYFMGITNTEPTDTTSMYTDTIGAPIYNVTARYEDVCIGDFVVHNGSDTCFISGISYECR